MKKHQQNISKLERGLNGGGIKLVNVRLSPSPSPIQKFHNEFIYLKIS